jgi:hypothetical protein
MDLLKGILGKIVTGIVALTVIAAGISWFQMTPQDRSAILQNAGRIAGWVGVVLALPWATFFIIRKAAEADSNLAGAILVFTYTAAEIVGLLWLFDWHVSGGISWIFLTLGGLLAAGYNLLICDWIAERFE